MRASHVRKILARLDRVLPLVDDEKRLKQLCYRVFGRTELMREVGNRAADMRRLLTQDIPEMLESIEQLKATRSELRQQLHMERLARQAQDSENDVLDTSKILSGEGHDIPHYGE